MADIPTADVWRTLLHRSASETAIQAWTASDPYADVEVPDDLRRAGRLWMVRKSLVARSTGQLGQGVTAATQIGAQVLIFRYESYVLALIAVVVLVGLSFLFRKQTLRRVEAVESTHGSMPFSRSYIAGALYEPVALLARTHGDAGSRIADTRRAATLLAGDAVDATRMTTRDLKRDLSHDVLKRKVDRELRGWEARLQGLAARVLADDGDRRNDVMSELLSLAHDAQAGHWYRHDAVDPPAGTAKTYLPLVLWACSAAAALSLNWIDGVPEQGAQGAIAVVAGSLPVVLHFMGQKQE